MKVAVYRHQTKRSAVSGHIDALVKGITEVGDEVVFFENNPPEGADSAVVWGERKRVRIADRAFNKPVLVVERGYLGDRMGTWTSLGWDGLNGRARFNPVFDSNRFERYHGHLLKPWKYGSGYALLAGQVAGDMNLVNVHIYEWYEQTARALIDAG